MLIPETFDSKVGWLLSIICRDKFPTKSSDKYLELITSGLVGKYYKTLVA